MNIFDYHTHEELTRMVEEYAEENDLTFGEAIDEICEKLDEAIERVQKQERR